MTDTRFTTVASDVDGLPAALDIDELDDLENLLMVLLHRPFSVVMVEEGGEDDGALETVFWDGDMGTGIRHFFPMSAIELVREVASDSLEIERSGARSVQSAPIQGIPEDAGESEGAFDPAALPSMDDDELIVVLREALGRVRLFNVMFTEDES